MKNSLITNLLIIGVMLLLGSASIACDSDDTESPVTASTEVEPTNGESGRLKVATTTSLDNTGLWETLEPLFEEQNDVDLDIVAVGTGIALEYGRNGDVDVITVHSKAREIEYVDEGYGLERIPFAYNYFLIVGPEDDPAGIRGMSPEDAFKTLFGSEAGTFVSRGDDSGTHGKEKTIWANAGYEYEDVQSAGSWYLEAGSGMGATLVMADEKQGYTLTDAGTYLSYKGDLELVPIVDEGDTLLNVYSIIVGTNTEMPQAAQKLVDFLTSDEIQHIMGNFGFEEYGMALFTPCAGPIAPCNN
ncbi:MAG: extracellular solute-binding protein [Chloroflexi bacterium]|nr:extracellular solute-binding protein [Chloroflexota bacterium]